MRSVARWEAKGGKRFVELFHEGGTSYSYKTDNGGGTGFAFANDVEAIKGMEAPWGPHTGPVTVLREDFISTKRVR